MSSSSPNVRGEHEKNILNQPPPIHLLHSVWDFSPPPHTKKNMETPHNFMTTKLYPPPPQTDRHLQSSRFLGSPNLQAPCFFFGVFLGMKKPQENGQMWINGMRSWQWTVNLFFFRHVVLWHFWDTEFQEKMDTLCLGKNDIKAIRETMHNVWFKSICGKTRSSHICGFSSDDEYHTNCPRRIEILKYMKGSALVSKIEFQHNLA